MRKKNAFLTALLATTLLVGGSTLVGCSLIYTPNSDTTTTTTYNIAIAEANGVDATLSTTTAEEGDEVTITINEVPEGYEVSTITTDVTGLSTTSRTATEYYFYMPASDVNLTINIAEIVLDSYTLTIDNQSTSARISYIQANYEDVNANDDGTYTIDTNATVYVILVNGGDYKFELNGSDITSRFDSSSTPLLMFTMPAQDSTLTITDAVSYSITVNYTRTHVNEYFLINTSNQQSVTSAFEGTELYLSIETNSGYAVTGVLFSPTVNYTADSYGYTFNMPASDLTITITTEASSGSGGDETSGNTLSITKDSYVTVNVYESAVLTDTSTNPNSYSVNTNNSALEYETGATYAFTATVSTNYANIYEIDEILVNGSDVSETAQTLTYNYTSYGSTTSTQLTLYTFTIEEGANVIEITTKDKPLTLTIELGDGEGAALYYQSDTNNEIQGTDGVYTVSYGDELRVEFTNTNESLKLTDVTKSYTYISWAEVSENIYTFTMPSRDLTLDPVWSSAHSVNITYAGSSTSGLDDTAYVDDIYQTNAKSFTAYVGDTVRLEYWWSSSTSLSIESVVATTEDPEITVNVTYEGQDDTDAHIYTFTMPDQDVEIVVTFGDGSSSSSDPTDGGSNLYVTHQGAFTTLTDNYITPSSGSNAYWQLSPDSSSDGTYVWYNVGAGVSLTYSITTPSNYTSYEYTITDDLVTLVESYGSGRYVDWDFTMPESGDDVYITFTWTA